MAASANVTSADAVAAAHARLLQDRSLQFTFETAPTPPPPPSWLVDAIRALIKALQAMGPAAKYGLWALLAIVVLLILAVVVREFVLTPAGRRDRPADLKDAESWRPNAARARALLEDADRLAAEGRFAEAVHLLLFRSIEDVEGRRPDLIAPSLTSRDIAALSALPPGRGRRWGASSRRPSGLSGARAGRPG